MTLIEEHNKKYDFFRVIIGEAMRVHCKFHGGLLESAYEAAFTYLLEQKGLKVERQVFLACSSISVLTVCILSGIIETSGQKKSTG